MPRKKTIKVDGKPYARRCPPSVDRILKFLEKLPDDEVVTYEELARRTATGPKAIKTITCGNRAGKMFSGKKARIILEGHLRTVLGNKRAIATLKGLTDEH